MIPLTPGFAVKTFRLAALSCLVVFSALAPSGVAAQRILPVKSDDTDYKMAARDAAFLEDVSHRSFKYFWEQADPQTGLVLDRARSDGSTRQNEPHRKVANIAATGFALTALCIAAERQWVSPAAARLRARKTLRFLWKNAPQEHGFFYHWMDVTTGARVWQSEASSIDTALLLAGALTARGYFDDDPEIKQLVTSIYERVDFAWMLNGDKALLSHGWHPETGFIQMRWNTYSEHMILNLLAIASPTHPIPPSAWTAWHRQHVRQKGYSYIAGGPLFIHQYSHAWFDFRNITEGHPPYTNYFTNSVIATYAHRTLCLEIASRLPSYSGNVWGVTASDSEKGYIAWGEPPLDGVIDGTVVPSAAGGSLMFTPDISIAALRTMHAQLGKRIYGRYAFTDAYNPLSGWVGPDVIAINVGITLLSAENLRTGNVWRWFMSNPEMTRAIELCGFRQLSRSGRTKQSGRRSAPKALP